MGTPCNLCSYASDLKVPYGDDTSFTKSRVSKFLMPNPGSVTNSLRFDTVDMPACERELRAEVREFLAEERMAGRLPPRRRTFRFAREFSRRLGVKGYIGMTWPKAYGGHQRSSLERYIVNEELLAAGAPNGAHFVADRQTGPLLLRFGSERQKQSFLPRIAAGECSFCIGMSEPNSGSDLASIQTTARRTSGGWLVNGTKLWTSWAHQADYMLALVRTSPPEQNRHAGMSQVIIDLKSDGIDIRPIYNLAGEHEFNEEVLTDCFVPDDMVVGEVGQGWDQVTSELAYERSGPERFLLTFQVFVELVRIVGSNPSRQASEVLGRLAAQLMTLRSMSFSVAGMLQQGKLPNVEAAVVKDLGTNFAKLLPEVARRLVQGEETCQSDDTFLEILEEAILYSPTHTIQGGTREILRGIIARGLGL
jgi:alkylation response protein AidB-like acyl-CoA dehydrogenase